MQRWWVLYPNHGEHTFFSSFQFYWACARFFKALTIVSLNENERVRKGRGIHKFQTCQSICTERLALLIINERMVDLMVSPLHFAHLCWSASICYYKFLIARYFRVSMKHYIRDRKEIVSFYRFCFVTKSRLYFRSLDEIETFHVQEPEITQGY